MADVTLAVGIEGSDPDALRGRGFAVAPYQGREALVELVAGADIAFCQLIDPEVVRRGMAAGCRFIFDLYNALPAEAVGAEKIGGFDGQPQKDDAFAEVVDFFRFCMKAGSYFVTSNERQRDYWIGYMTAADGLRPSELDGRHASQIVGLVPFGMEDGEPQARSHGIRSVEGISPEDFVLVWAGGIWDWFDAETPIRAVARLRKTHPEIRLVFYGTTHPNILIGEPAAVARAKRLAADLGILDNGVHFINGWIPADRRADYLLDADVALSAHRESFETRYAFRTRILDHFWASLPSVVTEGDWFADYIDANRLGKVVAYADVEATAAAILELRDETARSHLVDNVRAIREDWRWSSTTGDLVEIVQDWRRALKPRVIPAGAESTSLRPTTTRHTRWRWIRSRLSGSPLGTIYRRMRRR
ncbi:MAG: glycosyltransferase [Microbacterium sp.]|uniref:glycosyltransferase n=1 Tax=Microbacterium sp. TaxID=51671 RepID=UPI0039E6545D